MITAYDLDGVFISDWDRKAFEAFKNMKDGNRVFETGNAEHLPYFESRRDYPKTIFIPEGDYYIVTGRPAGDWDFTKHWIDANLSKNPPLKVFHENNSIYSAAAYKAGVILNNPEIKVFIESEKSQVTKIQNYLADVDYKGCEVLHFATMIRNAITLVKLSLITK